MAICMMVGGKMGNQQEIRRPPMRLILKSKQYDHVVRVTAVSSLFPVRVFPKLTAIIH